MDIQIRALESFQHGYLGGRLDAVQGGEYTLDKGNADDLVKAGLVEIVTEDAAPQTGVTDSQAADDLLSDGDTKAEPAPENKMAPAPSNKAKK